MEWRRAVGDLWSPGDGWQSMNAKAMICRELGPPERLVYDGIELSHARDPARRLIRIRRIGVNFPDKLIIAGGYQLKPPLPFVPGTEVAGGGNRCSGRKMVPRRRIMFVSARQRDGDHAHRRLCRGGGGAVSVPYAQCPMVSPYRRPRRIQSVGKPPMSHWSCVGALVAGETALILGAAGGVGLAAVQLARALGATVIATGSTPEKREAALASRRRPRDRGNVGDLKSVVMASDRWTWR